VFVEDGGKWSVRLWTGFFWLRIFISWQVERLSTAEKQLCSLALVT